MNDLRKEVRMQCSLTRRLVRSRMRWAGHLVRMDAGKLAKRAEMGGLHAEGYEKIGEDKRWRGGIR